MVKVEASVPSTQGKKVLLVSLDSALLRTAVYTTLRMGIFYSLSDTLKAQKGGSQVILTPLEKAGCAFIAGSVGSFLGTPFDVSLVRM